MDSITGIGASWLGLQCLILILGYVTKKTVVFYCENLELEMNLFSAPYTVGFG